MCLDIRCGDCTGNVQKHMYFTAMLERKGEENTGKPEPPPKKTKSRIFCPDMGEMSNLAIIYYHTDILPNRCGIAQKSAWDVPDVSGLTPPEDPKLTN